MRETSTTRAQAQNDVSHIATRIHAPPGAMLAVTTRSATDTGYKFPDAPRFGRLTLGSGAKVSVLAVARAV
jgi:hypothetical protein